MSLTIQLFVLALYAQGLVSVPLEQDESKAIADEAADKKYLTVDNIPKCNQNDEKLNECIKSTFNAIWQRLRDGDPTLNIAGYEPFVMNRTTLQYTNGPISGRITVKRMEIHGFSGYQVKSVDVKFINDKLKLNTVAFMPKMFITGQYKADMTFNSVHVKPKGEFNVTLLNVDIKTQAEGDLYKKDGHRFVHLTSFNADPKIGDLKVKANGIFPDPALDEVILSVANEYWRDVYSIMLPETRQYWQPLVLKIANEALKIMPIDNFIDE